MQINHKSLSSAALQARQQRLITPQIINQYSNWTIDICFKDLKLKLNSDIKQCLAFQNPLKIKANCWSRLRSDCDLNEVEIKTFSQMEMRFIDFWDRDANRDRFAAMQAIRRILGARKKKHLQRECFMFPRTFVRQFINLTWSARENLTDNFVLFIAVDSPAVDPMSQLSNRNKTWCRNACDLLLNGRGILRN